jgi:outer membrane protein assembly factor BamE (lipoprotein component of BamABCDE complex)
MNNSASRAARLFVLTAVAFAISGCMTMGRPFPADRIAAILIGTTTRDEIHAKFGEPYRTGIEDGDSTWTYLLYHFSAFNGEKTRDLYIRFDASDKVKSYAFNTNDTDASPH